MRCYCGQLATVRLRYTARRRKDGTSYPVLSDPKCNRCADRAAFFALAYSTDLVHAERIERKENGGPGGPQDRINRRNVRKEKTVMPTATKKKVTARKPVAKKTTAKPTTAKRTTTASKNGAAKRGGTSSLITEANAKKVLKMRDQGKSWQDIAEEFNASYPGFPIAIRPLIKKLRPSSVRKIGRGSPTYGSGASKAATTPKAKATAKSGAKKTAAKSAAKSAAKTTAGKAGGPGKGRSAASRALLEAIWNLDTPNAKIIDMLTGSIITVKFDEHPTMTPQDIKVSRVLKVEESKKHGGKIVEIRDHDLKTRIINLREVVGYR